MGLRNWFSPYPSSVIKKIITGDLESIMTSKWENNDEICRILAYVYLVEHETVLFSTLSVSSTFLIITAMVTPTACWAGISGSGIVG